MKVTSESQKIADAVERSSALDPQRSFIVQAPAGSGKTELLIKRYLSLLSVVEKPEEILAITFTLKATGEISRRIIDALKRAERGERPGKPHEIETYELAERALERDKRLGWGIIENPARLRVQTIDGLAAYLARSMPLLAARGAASPTEDPLEFYNEAARRVAGLVEDEGADGESVRAALSHFDNSSQRLVRLLSDMLGKRDQWLRHAPRTNDEDFKRNVEKALADIIEDALSCAFSVLSPYIERTIKFGRYAAANLAAEGKESSITRLKDMDEPPGTRVVELDKWRGVAELLLTDKARLRKTADKRQGFPAAKKGLQAEMRESFKNFLDELAAISGIEDAIGKIKSLPKPKYSNDEWNILKGLLHLLPMAERELQVVFDAAGKTDFQSVTFAALRSLGTDDAPTDLMLALDCRLKHVLVDEFQDTSITHLKLIEALVRGWEPNDGRTLFLVGDPMQSIYLFRDAEVGIFIEAQRKKALGPVALEPLTLKSNFRSDHGIVDWVNRVVGQGFPIMEDALTSAVCYSKSEAIRQGGGKVNVALYAADDPLREAADVLSIVSGIKARSTSESIAVLARTRAHLGEIIEAFEREGVDFRTKDVVELGESQAVLDLFSLLKALMHSHDRAAWLAVLRAPWCGLGLSDLLQICMGNGISPVFELISDPARLVRMSPEGRERLERIRPALEEAFALYGRVKTAPLIEGLWLKLGAPAALASPDDMADASVFLEMLYEMEAAGEALSVKSIEGGLKRLFASHRGKTSSPVEVMTMHGAKGLEFDHVILPGLGKKSMRDDKEMVVFLETGEELLAAPVEGSLDEYNSGKVRGIYDFLREYKRKRAENERTRLLYVAATRARKTLHVFGHVKEVSGGIEASPESLLAIIQDNLSDDLSGGALRASTERSGVEAPAVALPDGPPLKRLKKGWTPPPLAQAPEGILSAVVEESVREEAHPAFDWAGETARRVGTVVHAYFARIVKEGVDKWDLKRVAAENKRIESMLFALGLNQGDAKKAAKDCLKLLESALTSKTGKWVLERRATSDETEYGITGVIDSEIRRMVVDRTFVDEEGTRWVVDYKTGSHTGGDLEAFLAEEKERYSPQLRAYEKVVSELDKGRKVKCALYYPALDKLIEY